jgi:NAD+ synthase
MEAKENQLSEDSFSEREKIVFDRFLSLNRQNKHKMIPIPVCEIPEVYL